MKIQIKATPDMTSQDMIQVYILRGQVFSEEQKITESEADQDDYQALHVLLKDGDDLVGYAKILDRGDHQAIGRVLIAKSHRGRGLGRCMLQEVLDYIGPEKEVRLAAQSYVQGLYLSLGFTKVSDEYMEAGIPHVDMVLGANPLPD